MEQLLSITSVPMKYELSINHAQLQYTSQQSQVMVNRTDGGLKIQHTPAKLNISTQNARNSMTPSLFTSIRQAAQKGAQKAMDVTARYAQEGQQMMKSKPGEDVLKQIFAQRSAPKTGEFELGFLPSVGPDIQYVEADFNMQYQADRLQFDVRVSNGNVEYVPGSIDMNITQWPDVIIEYIGKPHYVPASTAERFEASA